MPRDTSNVRLGRLNRIMTCLLEHRRVGKNRLLEVGEYDESRRNASRTFERDVEILRGEFGVRLEYDRRGKVYVLAGPGRFLLHFGLDERQAEAMAAGLSMAAHFLPHLAEDCDRLSERFRVLLPPAAGRQVEEMSRILSVAHPVGRMEPGIFETLLLAIRRRRAIRAEYGSPWNGRVPRVHLLHPWGVYFRAHAWYLWAATEGHEDSPGSFRISRFRSMDILEVPRLDPPRGCDLEGFAGSAWYGCPGETRHRVRIRFRGALGEVMAETCWHPSQRLEREPDGSLVLEVEVPDLDDLARWVLTNGTAAEVLEPEDLRQRVRSSAEEIARVYR